MSLIDDDERRGLPEGDRPTKVTLGPIEPLGGGYRPYARHHFTMPGKNGAPQAFDRDVVKAGNVVGVIPLDLTRGEIVLLRQFRVAAHIATGKGELVEIVAGRIDGEEGAQAAACRECREEIGLDPLRMVEIMSLLPAAAFADELMSLWLAEVDARDVPELTGQDHEGEIIRPLRLSIDAALGLLSRGVVRSAPLIIALQWLALHRSGLETLLRDAPLSAD